MIFLHHIPSKLILIENTIFESNNEIMCCIVDVLWAADVRTIFSVCMYVYLYLPTISAKLLCLISILYNIVERYLGLSKII